MCTGTQAFDPIQVRSVSPFLIFINICDGFIDISYSDRILRRFRHTKPGRISFVGYSLAPSKGNRSITLITDIPCDNTLNRIAIGYAPVGINATNLEGRSSPNGIDPIRYAASSITPAFSNIRFSPIIFSPSVLPCRKGTVSVRNVFPYIIAQKR